MKKILLLLAGLFFTGAMVNISAMDRPQDRQNLAQNYGSLQNNKLRAIIAESMLKLQNLIEILSQKDHSEPSAICPNEIKRNIGICIKSIISNLKIALSSENTLNPLNEKHAISKPQILPQFVVTVNLKAASQLQADAFLCISALECTMGSTIQEMFIPNCNACLECLNNLLLVWE